MIQIITHPGHIPDETTIWKQLLNEGADSILLRKPGWPAEDYEALLLQTDPVCYPKLIIADHAVLCGRYGLQGVHFGEHARAGANVKKQQFLSSSIHSVDTLHTISNDWDQLLLSPVFDSISKKGYRAAFDENFRLGKNGFKGTVLALGGINANTAGKARDMLFDGIALLGAIWEDPKKAVSEYSNISNIWRKKQLT